MRLLDRKGNWIALVLVAALAGYWQLRNRDATSSASPLRPADAVTSARMNDAYGKLPLGFEANRGQAGGDIRFLSRGAGYGLSLKANEAELRLRVGNSFARLTMKLRGANPTPRIEGLEERPGRSNYLTGNDPAKWRTDVANYAKVRYAAVYPGIDLIFHGNQQHLEYDFVLAPGADPRAIRLQFAGAKRLRVGAEGDLILATTMGEVRQRRPIVYQETIGGRQEVAGRYVIGGRNQVSFAVGEYDASRPLVIDPVIVYASYLGGSGQERAKAVAVDSAGNVYVAGYTTSSDFNTTPGAFRSSKASAGDVFVTKINPAGTALVYSTYLGGHQEPCCILLSTDGGLVIDAAVDGAGAVYVTGHTTSRDFPVTPGALQPALNCAPGSSISCHDAFVTKLNASGNALVYSTYLGGNGFDAGTGIAVDAAGAATISGRTDSSNFPLMPAAFQPGGGMFLATLNPAGASLVFSTRFGSPRDIAYGVAVDAASNAYLTGVTFGGLPNTAGLPPTDGVNAFVLKWNLARSMLIYSAYLGGTGFETAYDIAADSQGSAYVTGYTFSRNFPVTPGAFQPTHGGGDQDVFVTKLHPTNGSLVYSTYLGGGNTDLGYGIAVDAAGRAAVTGASFSTDFPVTSDALAPRGRGLFVTRLDATGTGADYSSFLGGSSGTGYGAATAGGDLVVIGEVFTNDFSATPNAVQQNYRGNGDLFITGLSGFTAPSQTVVTNVSGASYAPAIARGSIVAAFGPGLANLIRAAGTTPLPTALGGVTVKVRDSANVERLASFFFVSPNQINYLLPDATSEGMARIAIERGGVEIATEQKAVAAVAPGLFSANANGQGVAAAVALRLNAFGMLTYEPVARFDPQQGRHVAVPLDLGPEGDQVFLQLFGTGIRNRTALSGVSARIGGTAVEVLYAGLQPTFAGLDQVNVRLPRTLAERGEADIVLTVDGKLANAVQVNMK